MTKPEHQDNAGAKISQEARLSLALEKNLLLYATAASAAGVSLLALSQPAEARIVYTPAHRVLRSHHSLTLDLNHDRVGDFTISNHAFCTTDVCGRTLAARPLGGRNRIAGRKGVVDTLYAYALNRGSTIGPKIAFSGKLMAASGTEYGTVGQWLNVNDRYLGLEFIIKGQVHFGWARLSVTAGGEKITATLSGYAYETVPNKPVIAGKTKGAGCNHGSARPPGSFGAGSGNFRMANQRWRDSVKREVKNLSSSLEHGLSMYALAASAAGVGLLAWPQSADAKIVYARAHVPIPPQAYLPVFLDLNHDGLNDFSFMNYSVFGAHFGSIYLHVAPVAKGNGILGQKNFASAVRAGVRIGGQKQFPGFAQNMAVYFSYHSSGGRSSHGFGGPWANDGKGVRNRYLGLKFLIKGETHYGWARLNVKVEKTSFYGTLTGYAYETVPNKPIVAGKTKGPDVMMPAPGSLGQLARGGARQSAARKEPDSRQ